MVGETEKEKCCIDEVAHISSWRPLCTSEPAGIEPGVKLAPAAFSQAADDMAGSEGLDRAARPSGETRRPAGRRDRMRCFVFCLLLGFVFLGMGILSALNEGIVITVLGSVVTGAARTFVVILFIAFGAFLIVADVVAFACSRRRR